MISSQQPAAGQRPASGQQPPALDQSRRKIQTVTEFLMSTQPAHSKGDFTLLMVAIQTAVKVVEKNIRRAGEFGLFGCASAQGRQTNATGDDQAKLDVISNTVFKAQLASTEKILVLGSEEEDSACMMPEGRQGSYIICFDPLDGSSNIDANVTVGSIWGIWRSQQSAAVVKADPTKSLLNVGTEMVSAGYAMYGSATNLVITTGHGVNGFTLDPTIGEFLLTHPNMRIGKKRIYSVNEGNSMAWHPWFRAYIEALKAMPDQKNPKKPLYSLRYIGSMVGDVHRTLLYGGIFMYPGDVNTPDGKLRYLYEAAPMAFLMEQAGGRADLGDGRRILEVKPTTLHQRVPVFLGAKEEVARVVSFYERMGKQQQPKTKSKL
jgi:fructose-1,6-bisphosphatase I